MSFNFNPTEGLLNTDIFPSETISENAARQQFMTLFNQIKTHINTNLPEILTGKGFKAFQGGFTAQWGVYTVTNGIPITFQYPFKNACLGVIPIPYQFTGTVRYDGSTSTTASIGHSNSATTTIFIFAIGF